jgi:hypothetical protein
MLCQPFAKVRVAEEEQLISSMKIRPALSAEAPM